MIQLFDKESGDVLGEISEDDVQFLIDHLEEETEDDVDYYINGPTIEGLKEEGIGSDLLNILETALGDREHIEIEWSRTE